VSLRYLPDSDLGIGRKITMEKKLCQFAAVLFLLVTIPHAWALQAGTPEEALEEMATADSIETVTKHLPVKVEEYVKKLPRQEQGALAGKLLVSKNLEREGGSLTRSDDGSAWELVEKEDRSKAVIRLKKTFVAGADALIQMEITEERGGEKHTNLIMLGMRYESNEWRLSEVGEWRGTDVESEFLPKAGAMDVHSSSAASTLRTLNTAIVTYATTYPDFGYPASLPALSGQQNQEPAPDHAMLLDQTFAREPVIRNGYQFRYTRTGQEHYQITATPVQYSDGLESFFTDESAVIRFTSESRPANAGDQPLD
jgi:type IV pilus assembly protein PilA